MSKQKILIVDDDNNIAELISLYLTKECFETSIVNDGEQVMSITFKTDLNAEKISFVADGVVKIDILKYEIR